MTIPNVVLGTTIASSWGNALGDAVNDHEDRIDNIEATGWVTSARIADGTIATADLADNQVTNGKLRDSSALSVIGRSANSTGDPADIAAGTDGHVLRRSGTTLGFGTIATAGIADAAVTNAKIASGVDAAKLTTGTLPIARIADGAVTNAKIASGVDGLKVDPSFSQIVSGTTIINLHKIGKLVIADGQIGSGVGIQIVEGWRPGGDSYHAAVGTDGSMGWVRFQSSGVISGGPGSTATTPMRFSAAWRIP